jgi:subtilisin family serine protease
MLLSIRRAAGALGLLCLALANAHAASYLVVSDTGFNKRNLKVIGAADGTVVKVFSQVGIAVVESDNPDFASIGGFAAVIPDLRISAPQTLAVELGADVAQPPFTGDDDFFFDLQWGHTSARAQEAWAAGATGKGVRVFVLDEGFDMDHPDLAPNLNVGLSTSFVPLENEGTPDYILPDPFSHGTHVAGTIAAADNGFGTIGIAPDAELVFVKVLSEIEGSGAFSWIIGGILYATENEADVINMSLGTIIPQGLGPDSRFVAELRSILNRVITYAYRKGATVIVSAGNDGLDLNSRETASLINFNGYASHAISISAVGPEGWALDPANADLNNQAYYTNIGTEIDFAGQGGTVDFGLLESGQACDVAGLIRPCYVFDFVFSTGNGGWYWSIGTSMAAPHAAGVAAIIIGENGGSMNPALVKQQMRQRAADLGRNGVDDLFGYGLVTTGY